MKKTGKVAIALAAALSASAVGALAGCGESKENTIEVFLLANNTETQFYMKYFEDFEQELKDEGLDYHINFNSEQESQYYDSLKASINGGETPDIFYIRPNEILQYKDKIASLQSYADSQTVVDLSDIYETALDMYRYNPSTGELGNKNDDLYAFPKDLSTQQLGYNRTLLEKFTTEIKGAGLKMPWEMNWEEETYTWDEYKKMCTIINENKSGRGVSCASDVPSVEVLAKSFGGSLIDLSGGRQNGKVSSLTSGALKQAIEYQADLVDCGAADYKTGTYANFTAGRVCFYGLVGSWEVKDYNDHIGDGKWEVMPWPTKDGGTKWYGLITSAGYVVSKECADSAKGDIAKRIAISFMSSSAQNKLVKEENISLPLRKSVEDDYKDAAQNSVYKPASRGVFLDVVSGKHGVFPARYSTYDKVWLDKLDTALETMWNEGKGKAKAACASTDWAKIQQDMQAQYDDSKSK